MGRFFVRCLIVRIWVDQWTNEHIEMITTLQHVASFCRVISAKGKSSARGTGREHVRGTQCAARHPCPSMPCSATTHAGFETTWVQGQDKVHVLCICLSALLPKLPAPMPTFYSRGTPRRVWLGCVGATSTLPSSTCICPIAFEAKGNMMTKSLAN